MSFWAAGKRLSADAFSKFIQAGTESVTFTSDDSFTQDVTFPVEFDDVPAIAVNIASGASSTARWDARAITVTKTGFTLFVYSNADAANAAWSDITVYWIAVAI